ncbi:MAG: DnaD domain protein, partial [Clostridia bacterium]
NELTPNDRYLVRVIRPISFAEMGFFTHLYLPLIGIEAYSLYHLLLHEVQEASGASAENTHRGLMLMAAMPLDRILSARERLEAMGLMEVYRRENRQRDYYFEYRLKPPLSPKQFFAEDIWPVMLLNQVGNMKYEQIRRKYADQLACDLEQEYPYEENMTKPFYEVYQTLTASELDVRPGSETDKFMARMEIRYPAAALDSMYEAQVEDRLSLSSLRLNLPKELNATEILTNDNIQFFYKLMHFYQMDSWVFGVELADWTLYKHGRLDSLALRKRLLQKYLGKELQSVPVQDADVAAGSLPEPGSVGFVRVCRRYSPLSLLELVVGGRVNKTFAERAEALVFTDGLTPEVVNALLLHSLRSTQMELPKTYVETVRDSWKAQQITTVEGAVKHLLERAEAQGKASPEVKKTKRETTNRRGTRTIPQDKLPASVQRQLEREQTQEKAENVPKQAKQAKKTVKDVPELHALLQSLRNREKGGGE